MNSIRMTSEQFDELRSNVLANENEAAAFLVAGYFENNHGVHFTVRHVVVPDSRDYDFQSSYRLEISPMFFNKVIGMAEASNTTIIQCHSHPFSKENLRYSISDYVGERSSSDTVYSCLGKPMGSMLLGPRGVVGRAWLPNSSKPVEIGELRLVDKHFEVRSIGSAESKTTVNEKIFDRQIRAFGLKGQLLLSRLRVGIAGVGGTGSAVAEQLVREGVTDLVLVDHDKFEPSNITRIYGSKAATEHDYKVNIVSRHLKKIQSGIRIEAIPQTILSGETMLHFKDCDVVFSCMDKHAPRSVLNELAHQYFIPVIDMGVGIDSRAGLVEGGTVRATLISPSVPCLFCSGIISPDQILAESLNPADLISRQKEGYVQGMNDDVPSVIVLTTMAASYAVLLLKDLLFHLITGNASTIVLDISSFTTSRLTMSIKKDCTCALRMGMADYFPLSVT